MRYFKMRIGYGNGGDDRYIAIDETELESALYCFISNSKGVFKNGVVRGQDIISITEDWHRAMGWNNGHVMEDLDYAELESKGILKQYAGVIGEVKNKIQYLIETNQHHLIGKNSDIPGFGKKPSLVPPEVAGQVNALAEKMKLL